MKWLKYDLIKLCSVEFDLDITKSIKNPLFFGLLFILGNFSGCDQAGNIVEPGGDMG